MALNGDVPGYEDDAIAWRDNLQAKVRRDPIPERPLRLASRSLGEFSGIEVPQRDWLVSSVIVRRSITLLGGDGGVGKSLACMQLQVAAALAVPWLGIDIKEPVMSFGFYCEDDEDELHRRFAQICDYYGTTFDEIGDRVRFVSRVGQSNELLTFRDKSEYAEARLTDTFRELEEEVQEWGHELVILDTVSDVFAGNENNRYQVKTFATHMRKLALPNKGGIIMTAHPSKSAMIDGSGYSGTTAWNGAVRNRLYLTTPRRAPDEDEAGPTDERVLRVMKSNYGPYGEKIKCKWTNGVFVETAPNAHAGSILDRLETDSRIMKAAEYLIINGTRLAASHISRSSFACLINSLPSCRELSHGALIAAQERLLQSGKLVRVTLGPPSDRVVCVRPTHLKYPGEKE